MQAYMRKRVAASAPHRPSDAHWMKPPHSQLQSERQADKWDRAAAVAHAEALKPKLKLRTAKLLYCLLKS
jgi:hypothetical protein